MQRRVSGGDSFEVFYAEDEDNENHQDLLMVTLSVGGATKHYYRFQNGEDGTADFFDEEGRSNRKFLIRKPISEGVLRSTFGMRYHPILRYSRMHTGIDWANKVGTPIIAAGDGRIRVAGWESGYGRRVEIEHPYNFVTTYNHMSAFARGVQVGARVRQGQVIGYLGSSGLSTGPHLHYEVMINENFVDPLSVKVPRNRELDAGAARRLQARAGPGRRTHPQGAHRHAGRRARLALISLQPPRGRPAAAPPDRRCCMSFPSSPRCSGSWGSAFSRSSRASSAPAPAKACRNSSSPWPSPR